MDNNISSYKQKYIKINERNLETHVYIQFIDKQTNIVHYETNINVNMWTSCSIKYFCDWKIIVKNLHTDVISIFNLDLNDKSIVNDFTSICNTKK